MQGEADARLHVARPRVVTRRHDVTTARDVSGNQCGNRQGGHREAPSSEPYGLSAALADRRATNAAAKAATIKVPAARDISSWRDESSPQAVMFTVGGDFSHPGKVCEEQATGSALADLCSQSD